jgi:hypothetical protein
MANTILFISSCVLGLITLYFVTELSIASVNILTGIVTSICNHATTSTVLKWVDRLMMCLAVVFHLVVMCYCGSDDFLLLGFAVGFYFLEKLFPLRVFHLLAHIIATILNITIISMDTNTCLGSSS